MIFLLNTCHIREKRRKKSYSELGRLEAAERAEPQSENRRGPVAWRRPKGAEIHAHINRLLIGSVGPQNPITGSPPWKPACRSAKTALDTDFPEEDKFRKAQGAAARRNAHPLHF